MSADAMIRLGKIATARSGDKGNHANVAVIAHNAAGYGHLCRCLTPERLRSYFSGLPITGIERYELPRIGALNFVLRDALAGGASGSLRIDTQGKLLGPALMQMLIEAPEDIAAMTGDGASAV
ncbi:MAG: hypothetical protein R3C10_15860 [Pirellulales bacterium]